MKFKTLHNTKVITNAIIRLNKMTFTGCGKMNKSKRIIAQLNNRVNETLNKPSFKMQKSS